MNIKIIETDNIEEFMQSDEFKAFNDQCEKYVDYVLAEAKKDLNADEIAEFDLWWTGKLSKATHKKAESAIMYTISMGLG